jgi:hypothetical protein
VEAHLDVDPQKIWRQFSITTKTFTKIFEMPRKLGLRNIASSEI